MTISKYISKIHLLILAGLVIVYILLNFSTIKETPIFTDEAIYVRWAQIAANDASLRYISLLDGKQPLFIWIAMIPVKIFQDSLLAVRLLSVIYGLISIFGIYFIGRNIKNSLVGLLSAALFVTSPFFFIYNRLAIYESLISTLGIYSLLFTILLIKKKRIDLAITLGFISGLGLMTKSSANFFIYLLPFSPIILVKNIKKLNKPNTRNTLMVIGLFFLSITISFTMYNTLRLFPLFNMIEEKNHTFILTNREFINNPFSLVFGNTPSLLSWIFQYLTPIPFILFILSGIYFLFRKKLPEIYLLAWIMVPFAATAFFGKIIYPRYLLFMVPGIFILISLVINEFFEKINSNKFRLLTVAVLFIGPIISLVSILTNLSNSFIPQSDKNQLINDWPAGGGIEEVVKIINSSAEKEKVFVGTEGTFGLLPYALEIELVKNPNVEIKGYYPVKEIPQEVVDKAKLIKTYFIYNLTQNENQFSDPKIKLVGKYPKGNSDVYLRLFEVK